MCTELNKFPFFFREIPDQEAENKKKHVSFDKVQYGLEKNNYFLLNTNPNADSNANPNPTEISWSCALSNQDTCFYLLF